MGKRADIYNLFTFFCLYIAQTIPIRFFSAATPVIMRNDGFSKSRIALILMLFKLPWILKFLWSPLVDRTTRCAADYKRWIFISELVYAALICAVAFLDLRADIALVFALIIAAFTASATQDIATDALAVLSFDRKDKSLVNSMQSMGSFGGAIIGGSLLLILFSHIGAGLLPLVAIFVLAALLPLAFNRRLSVAKTRPRRRVSMKDIGSFFLRRSIWPQIGFLLLYNAGITGSLAMIKPWLVDMGYGMGEIGAIAGYATLAGFVTSFAGGVIMRHIGRRRSRVLFSVLMLAVSLFILSAAGSTPSQGIMWGCMLLLWSVYGMATVVIYTTAMDCVRPGREGTDFTIQTVISQLGGIIILIVSGRVADAAGYHGLFLLEAVIAAISLSYVLLIFRKKTQHE